MARRKKNDIVTGIPWWRPEQWETLKEVSADRDALDDTYQDWKNNAESLIKTVRREGAEVRKVEVALPELVQWCEEQDRPLDGKARSEFVAKKMQEQSRQG